MVRLLAFSCLSYLLIMIYVGGNHFRYWQQTTTKAFFLASSTEMDAAESHNITPNGYDLGRDYIVGNATAGITSFGGVSYKTTNSYVTGLLQPGSTGKSSCLSTLPLWGADF